MRKLIPCLLSLFLFIIACNTDEPVNGHHDKFDNLKQAHQEFLQHTKDTEVAYSLLEKVRGLAQELNNDEYLAKYYANYGLLKEEDGIYGDAINAYQEAFNLYGSSNDSLRQAFILENIGYVYRTSKEYSGALKYFEKAEAVYTKLKDSGRLPGIYENIALTYMDKGDYGTSGLYLQKGLDLALDFNREKVSVLLNLYGKLHFLQGKYDQARAYYNQALAFNEDDIQTAYLFGNIGETYLKEGNVADAEVWLNKAMQQKRKLKEPDLRPNLNYMAALELLKHNTEAALNYYHQVLGLSANDLHSEEMEKALVALEEIYGADVKLLTTHIDRYKNFRDIYSKKYRFDKKSKEEMTTLYHQASLKAVEDEYRHKQILIEKDAKAMQLNYGIATALILLLVGRFLFLYHKRLRKAKKERDQHLVTVYERESDIRNIRAMLNELKVGKNP